MSRLRVIPDFEQGGFTARAPDIPANGEGDTEELAAADLREALAAYLEAFGIDDAMARVNSPALCADWTWTWQISRVPKLPRLAGAEMVRFLQDHGFAMVRIRSSHYAMQRGSRTGARRANSCV